MKFNALALILGSLCIYIKGDVTTDIPNHSPLTQKIIHLLPKDVLDNIRKQTFQRNNEIIYIQPPYREKYNFPLIRHKSLPPLMRTFNALPDQQSQLIDLPPISALNDVHKIRLRFQQPQPYAEIYPQYKPYQTPVRKHYRITLIRNNATPTTPPPNSAPEQADTEEKTLIYVLVKKPDVDEAAKQIELQQKAAQESFKIHPPEVYFIKYKENNSTTSNQSNH